MGLAEHVFLYCERGTSDALLAEPVNAASNVAFLLAALVGLILLLRRPHYMRSGDHFLLVGLVCLIGLGSLSFHLYANRLTELADVVPIGVFMLVYLGFALNRLLLAPPGWTVLILIGFAGVAAMTLNVQCWDGGIGIAPPDTPGAKACFNGSLGYLPALFAMVAVGLLLHERGHKAAPYVLWAAAVFTVSVTLRSLDLSLCDKIVFQGRNIGTHAAWHVLNALALFLLLRASLEAGWNPYGRPMVVLEPPKAAPVSPPAPPAEVVAAPAPEADVVNVVEPAAEEASRQEPSEPPPQKPAEPLKPEPVAAEPVEAAESFETAEPLDTPKPFPR